jgi:oligopeptide/dipeptide ABC transporter ATP-binding protein
MVDDTLLRVEGLTVEYRTRAGFLRALDRVSLSVRRGEIVSVVGETGSGKSTLALAIIRLLPRSARVAGKVLYNGVNLLELDEESMRRFRGREIAMIFQEPKAALNPLLTVGSQLIEAIEAHDEIERSRAREMAVEMLSKVGLPDPERILSRYPHELSGGMAQRVMIAMALLLKPKLLLADEPTSALDVSVQAQILDLLYRMVRELRTSVLFITHDLGVAAEVSDRVAVMYAGKVVEVAGVYDIFEKPLHPYTVGLLDSVPGGGRELKGIEGEPPSLINPPPGCRFHPRCPYAMDVCRRQEPPEVEVKDDHYVACHLYAHR